MRMLARFFGFLFATGAILFILGAIGVAGLVYAYNKDLPDYTQLKNYEPPIMTRVHAGDGSLLAEYSHERRLYLPSNAIPSLVKQAFISAEDKNFYTHNGIDPEGIARAAMVLLQGSKHMQGASTITQQVAKNFLLTNERSFDRKIKEALLSLRIEQTYSKERILELYLNEIYLGMGNYGIAAAALNYFDKSVYELTLAETAYLAGLPKGPNNYNPYRNRDAAVARRNYVIERMVDNGYVSRKDGDAAKSEPLTVNPRVLSANSMMAGYFAEEVRRELNDRYGDKKLYEGGLSVRTTLDPKMQLMARKALVEGLIRFDEAHGWRGALRQIEPRRRLGTAARRRSRARRRRSPGVSPSCSTPPMSPPASACSRDMKNPANLGHERETGAPDRRRRPLDAQAPAPGRFARRRGLCRTCGRPSRPVPPAPDSGNLRRASSPWTPIPAASSPWSAAFPSTSRTSTARPRRLRQPGSSFKPFVYATALDNGYTPSSIVLRRADRDRPAERRSLASRKTSRKAITARIRCATASNIRKT